MFGEAGAIKDVVAEGERHPIAADELPANDERLCQPARSRLGRVRETQSDIAAVSEQPSEAVLLVRCRNHEDLADAREHQR